MLRTRYSRIRRALLWFFGDASQIFKQFYSFYDRKFDREGPFWGRYYIFWHGGKPLTVIQEVFSPGMDRWIGRMDVSLNDHTSAPWAQQTLP